MNDIDLTAVIEAAAAALCLMSDDDGHKRCITHEEATGPDARWCSIGEYDAREAVETAAPLIERAVREQLAAEINAWLESATRTIVDHRKRLEDT